MSKERTYVPKSSVKSRQGPYGEFLSVGLNLESFIEFARQHVNERGYINLTISKRKSASDRGDTHSIYLDDYKPGDRRPAPAEPPPSGLGKFDDVPGPAQTDDVPF